MTISVEQKAKMATQLATMDALEKGIQGAQLLTYIKSEAFDKASKRYMDLFNDETLWKD